MNSVYPNLLSTQALYITNNVSQQSWPLTKKRGRTVEGWLCKQHCYAILCGDRLYSSLQFNSLVRYCANPCSRLIYCTKLRKSTQSLCSTQLQQHTAPYVPTLSSVPDFGQGWFRPKFYPMQQVAVSATHRFAIFPQTVTNSLFRPCSCWLLEQYQAG